MEDLSFKGKTIAQLLNVQEEQRTEVEALREPPSVTSATSEPAARFEAATDDIENSASAIKTWKSRGVLKLAFQHSAIHFFVPRDQEEGRQKQGVKVQGKGGCAGEFTAF